MQVWRNLNRLWVPALCLLMSGCAATDSEQARVQLQPARPFEPDVPVPKGFIIVDRASEDRSTGTTRLYLRHVYEGRASKHAIRTFYREEMPRAQWVKVSDGNIKGDLRMRFEKSSESCTISVTDSRRGFFKKARIEIIVAREERGQTPPQTHNETNKPS